MDEHRKMQGKAYEGIKSKIARNMKVIDRENKKQGYRANPYQRPATVNNSPLRGAKFTRKQPPGIIIDDQEPWTRNCTSKSPTRDELHKPRDSPARPVNGDCCCRTSPRNRSKIEVMNDYAMNVRDQRSRTSLSINY